MNILSSTPTPTLSLEFRRLPVISWIDEGRHPPSSPNLNAFFNSPPFASLARNIAVSASVVKLFPGRKLLLVAPGTRLSPLMSGESSIGMFSNDCTLLRARWQGSWLLLMAWMSARLPSGKSMASHVLPTWYIDVNLGWILLIPFMVMLGLLST